VTADIERFDALIKCDDALMAAARGMVTLVVLLDVTAAFYIVNHATPLDILHDQFGLSGFSGSALAWHSATYSRSRAYILRCDRSQKALDSGLPQAH